VRQKNAEAIWLVFLTGKKRLIFSGPIPDHTYGSKELAARLSLSGDLHRVKAVILVDMVGQRTLFQARIEFHSLAYGYCVSAAARWDMESV